MEKRRIVSVVMAVLMAVSLLPSMVFAAAAGQLGGKLRIKGDAAVGSVLQAEYGKAEPQGLTDEDVSFCWSRKLSESEFEEVGTDKKYTVTESDLGYQLVLEVTGREDLGLTGTLKAETPEVSLTAEEARQLVDQKKAEGAEISMAPSEEEAYDESLADAEMQTDESSEEIPEAVPEENYEDIQQEETPQESAEEPDADEQAEDAEFDVTVSEEINMGEELGTDIEAVPEEEPVYAAEFVTEDGTGVVDFGTVKQGAEEDAAKYVTLRNTGNQPLTFLENSPEHFMVADIRETLEAGAEVSLWIQPREGLEGIYDDIITYETDGGLTVSYEAKAVVEAETSQTEEPGTENPEPTEEPEIPTAPDYDLSADTDAMVFGALQEGYDAVTEEQYVTLTNVGEAAATLKMPEEAQYVTFLAVIDEGKDLVLEKGESVLIAVQPKLGIEAGNYSETLTFGLEENADVVKTVAVTVTVEPAEEEIIKVTADPANVEFQSLEEGYETTEPEVITLFNEGNTTVAVEQPLAENFDIGKISAAEIPAGGTAVFTVQPKAGLTEGIYSETIQIYRASEEKELLASVEVALNVDAKEPVYKLTVKPDYLDFGAMEAGYQEAPKAQRVTIVNEGNTAVTIDKPSSEYFKIGSLSQKVIEPGEEARFAVRPKSGLEESTYVETIEIPNDTGETLYVEAEFTVTMKAIALTGIQKPKDIVGLKNGTEKSAEAFGLPSSVAITTTDGRMKAKVQWNVKDCGYDRKEKEEQNFRVTGKVILPEGVENPDKISRSVSVKVNVKAAYVPKVPDASENKIVGIASEGYTTQSRISFEAVGGGMDNTSPRKGDVRFLPVKWKVINTNKWDNAPYSATFGITKPGTYTLSVLFERQKFDGSQWTAAGEQDTKQVQFTIAQAKDVTPTPTAQQRNADRRNAVETGDTTPILPFVIILVAAVGCIAAVVVYRKKK